MPEEEKPEQGAEMSDEEILSQIMLDMMAVKTLLIQKGVFTQAEFDETSQKIADEMTTATANQTPS